MILQHPQRLANGTTRANTLLMLFQKLALFIGLLSPVLLAPAYAQRGGGGHSSGGGGGARGGSVGGGGSRGGFSAGGSFRGGSFRGGYYGGRGYFYGGRYWGPSIYFGFGGWGYPYYPSYYSGYPYYGYDPYYYGYDTYPSGGDAYPPPPAPQSNAPQNYGYDQRQSGPPQQPPMQTQPQSSAGSSRSQGYYMIAFKDRSIQAATAYRVDGDQMYWITREGREMHAPMSSVDIQFTQQINRDRNVEFPIP